MSHNFIELGRKPEMSGSALILSDLMKEVLLSGKGYVSEAYEGGNLEEDSTHFILTKLEKLGGKIIYKCLDNEEEVSSIWKFPHGVVDLSNNGHGYVSLSIFSLDESFVRDICKTIRPLFVPTKKQGFVFAITQSMGRLMLSSLGNAGVPLVRNNYMPSVIDDYDFVVTDLQAESPSGRIVIMEGDPGTGKTHLIRGMLLDVPDTMFVLVSPEMVPQLAGPELLPLLLGHRSNTAGPIVLILEDADRCLVARDEKNIHSIQSLLNLGDGILGSMLDLRIIATTNARKLEMEKALMRPGRLSKIIHVGSLNANVAAGVYHKLLPENKIPDKLINIPEITLAEVYGVAREAGWTPMSRKLKIEKKLGKTEEPYDQKDIDYEIDD
jgi:hypothetical protein